jgi:hypothetical protein
VTFGPQFAEHTYSCLPIFVSPTLVRFNVTSAGIGGNLRFVVKVLGLPSAPSADVFHYPSEYGPGNSWMISPLSAAAS